MVSIQDMPDPERPETWRFQVVVSWSGFRNKTLSNEQKHKEVKRRAEGLPEVSV